ncbi:hypothetical protein M0R72_21870 [Candidatus Pacearchaeota archaeon]|jgi:hypothetical protein|nr:hypothetical protein [Candidatus Pacearchaeota archaeon]
MIESLTQIYKGIFGIPGTTIELISDGHQAPCEGDRCRIDVRVSIAADKENKLVREYRFGEQVSVCGLPLTEDWGKCLVQGLRTYQIIALSDTWPEGFEGALKQFSDELKPLKAALEARKEKVKQANWPYAPAK